MERGNMLCRSRELREDRISHVTTGGFLYLLFLDTVHVHLGYFLTADSILRGGLNYSKVQSRELYQGVPNLMSEHGQGG